MFLKNILLTNLQAPSQQFYEKIKKVLFKDLEQLSSEPQKQNNGHNFISFS